MNNMIEKIRENLESIEIRVKAIKKLFSYWQLDLVSLNDYGQSLTLIVKELNENINKYYGY